MYSKPKRASLLILGVIALVCSRVLFSFFDDPEGPNLLVVTVTAGMVCGVSLAAYLSSFSDRTRLVLAIFIQMLTVIGLYFCLR